MGESAKTFRDSARQWRRVMRWTLTGAVFAGLCGVAANVSASRIRGAITGYQHLLNPVWEESKDPDKHSYSFREPVPTVRAEFRRLFPHIPKELCVAAISAEKQPVQKPILIRVGGGRTTPVTIVVTPGTELQFQNT